MFCEGCGKPLNSESRFCANCGAESSGRKTRTEASLNTSTPEAQRKASKRYIWLFLILIPILFTTLSVIPASILALTIFAWVFVFPHAGISPQTSFAVMAIAVVIAATTQLFQRTSEPSTPATVAVSNPPVSAWRPDTRAPRFTIYRAKANMPIAVVISNACRASGLTIAQLLGHSHNTQILPTYVKPLDENTKAVIDALDVARMQSAKSTSVQ